jgi:hypothetical protein
MSDSHAAPVAAEGAPAKGKSGLLPKLLVGVFVGFVIAVECAAAYFLLPAPDEVSATGDEDGDNASADKSGHDEAGDAHAAAGEHGDHGDAHGEAKGHGAKDDHGAGGHGKDHGKGGHLTEVELGEFSITLLQPEAGMAYRVDFKIGATVDENDKTKFDELFAASQQRFRDQVMIEVRNCEISDLTDSGLGLIKRRISEKSNALFGAPLLQGVFFSEFSLVEQ